MCCWATMVQVMSTLKPVQRRYVFGGALATAVALKAAATYNSPVAFAPAAAPRMPVNAAPAEQGPLGGAATTATNKVGAAPAAVTIGAAVAIVATAATKKKHPAGRSTKQSRTAVHAVPDAADAFHHFQEWLASGGLEAIQQHVPHLPHAPFDFVPPAHAEDVVAQVPAAAEVPAAPAVPKVELDPNVKYLYGPDGNVLLDPYGNKPLVDDWWNGFVGIQKDAIVFIDSKLREAGVPQAFGWTIALYTLLIKVAFQPLTQGQLRTTSMMQLMQPKVKEIQERYKDDQETQSRLLAQLYGNLDVNPLGGCLPTFVQLPIFWSLFSVWRRLYVEKYPYYSEPWLWVPDLSRPNPDFQFKLDWVFDFVDGAPRMGWDDYRAYFIFPILLVGATLYQTAQSQASRPKNDSQAQEEQNLVLQILPLISVYFIGTLSLELPQAVSVYYTTNTILTAAQTALVKWNLRQEIPGYEEFEKTGKFPDSSFEELIRAATPPPASLHEACLRGDMVWVKKMAEPEEGKIVDLNAWDEKMIAPLGYAVACGHVEVVRDLLARGAEIDVKDGQSNTLLHYAAGYGHLECLQLLVEEGKAVWPNDEWAECKNLKNQNVYDAARVNSKSSVQDWLRQRLNMPAEQVEAEVIQEPEVVQTSVGAQPAAEGTDANAAARAALLAAVGGAQPSSAAGAQPAAATSAPVAPSAQAFAAAANLPPTAAAGIPGMPSPAGMPNGATAEETRVAMERAVRTLKENPEAVEKARSMIGSLPPSLLAAMSGGKMSEEDAKKAMEKMQQMSTKDMIKAADAVATKVADIQEAQAPGQVPPPVPAPVPVAADTPPKSNARAVD